MKKYIILEIIPTSLNPEKGDIVQLSALKIDEFKLLDRFDYRLNEDKISFKQFLEIINYDKDQFTYKDTTDEIINDFKEWTENLPLLVIDNEYTLNYLKKLDNKKESILKYLNENYTDDVIEKIIKKYSLQPSNYIVDILFEALIYESNNK